MSTSTADDPIGQIHEWPKEKVLSFLGTDPQRGLSESQVRERLERYGRNELAEAPAAAWWRKLLAQFQEMLVVLLLIAAGISTVLWFVERESALPYEAMAILAVVLLNAVMGYIQESRAESAVAALKQMAAAHANVIRDGRRQQIAAAELVPGDVLLVEEGDAVAADARLIESTALQTSEASLTGESLPVSKDIEPAASGSVLGDRHNMVFSGTVAAYGRGKAIVTATGASTEMGRIAGMLNEAVETATPLQEELNRVGKLLGIVVVVIAVVMVATIVLVEGVREVRDLFDVLILGVALAVAAVPEGLPAVATAVLSLGVQRMAQRNAIVRRLAAVETLGSANVIASDKTGTLTKNEMTVRAVVTASGKVEFGGTGYEPTGDVCVAGGGVPEGSIRVELERALAVADRANNASLHEQDGRWSVQGDPTEGALLVAARKAGLKALKLDSRLERVAEVPFSSERKLMSTVHSDAENAHHLLVFTKGAPDVLIARCTHLRVGKERTPLTDERRQELTAANEELAGQAMRTLAVASREIEENAVAAGGVDDRVEQGLTFLGLIGMIDPPREEAKAAVREARQAGIRPMMITGDHPKTAAVIAGELDISADGRVLTGVEVEQLGDDAFARAVREVSVYARVDPKHKLRIVKALQDQGATVAMTGDGVNDAPALKKADIGVAMGIAGTDVSKQAADMILTDDNFATIVKAVSEGRAIFANIRRFLRYLLSSNIGEVLTMFLGVLLARWIGLPKEESGVVLPLLATHILWINLMTDGAPALALGVDPPDDDVMQHPPRPRSEGVITLKMWAGIAFVGVIMAAGTLLVLDACLPGGWITGSGTMRYAQTMAFTTLMMYQLFNVFNARSESQSAFRGLWHNRWLWGAIALSLVLHVGVIYLPFLQKAFSVTPLLLNDWLFCAAVASSVLWCCEVAKVVLRLVERGSQRAKPA